ncbi:MAG: hypothetical protein CMK64_04860, partial [Pseudoalteromonas sp.]|nr:hypothetical protein [Pseudoalteromonas sp.]
NNFKTNDVNYNREDFVTAKLESEFTKWFDNWQYNKTDTKVCVLFARLLRCSIDKKGKLKLNNFKTSISQDDVSSLHLDHMEPRSGAEHEKSSYFIDPDREFIINGIGNMMPLPGRINISKSNKPLKESFSYLEEAGLGDHWFVKKSKDLFFDNNNKGVPKKKFFQERKALIRESFYSIIKEC